MTQVEAIFRHGVFEPLEPVQLKEEERVRLSIEPSPAKNALEWLEEVRVLRAKVEAREGILPDSTPDIAEDRLR